jgi:hypothetical protein
VPTSLSIPSRFNGPPTSANGGYTSGLFASLIDGPCEVTLRAPPPLDTPLTLSPSEHGGAVLMQDATLIAEASPRAFALELPDPVGFDDATVASRAYPGFHSHPYPTCFVCGTDREPGDGLRIWPGPVEDRRIVAAPWIPTTDLCRDGVVDSRFVWAALDCPSWFGFVSFAREIPPVLLGRMTVALARPPRSDQRCVVVGWSTGGEGRRIECASMLLDEQGACLAHSKSTWIALKSPA